MSAPRRRSRHLAATTSTPSPGTPPPRNASSLRQFLQGELCGHLEALKLDARGWSAPLTAAVDVLECDWRQLEQQPSETAAEVGRLVREVQRALERAAGGAGRNQEALVAFCEQKLLRSPHDMRGESARSYDMQTQLRLALVCLRGDAAASKAEYALVKKTVQMLGIKLAADNAGVEATPSDDPAAGVPACAAGCDVGAESPVPLPSTAAEYVLLLPRLLGELLPRDVLARLEGHFPPSSAVWGP